MASASETNMAAVVNAPCKDGSVQNALHDLLIEMVTSEEVDRMNFPGSIESDYSNLGTKFTKENSFMMAAVAVKRKSIHLTNDCNPSSNKKLCMEVEHRL